LSGSHLQASGFAGGKVTFEVGYMGSLLIVAIVLLAIILLFIALALPIWCLVNCVGSKVITSRAKTAWVLAVVFFWSLSALIYGSFATQTRSLKWASRICLGVLIIALGLMLSYIPDLSTGAAANLIRKLDSIEYVDISANEIKKLKSSMAILRDEFKEYKFSINNFRKRYQLLTIIKELTKDSRLTRAEYDDWMRMFESREYLDINELMLYELRLLRLRLAKP
jgi:hypothetical protein